LLGRCSSSPFYAFFFFAEPTPPPIFRFGSPRLHDLSLFPLLPSRPLFFLIDRDQSCPPSIRSRGPIFFPPVANRLPPPLFFLPLHPCRLFCRPVVKTSSYLWVLPFFLFFFPRRRRQPFLGRRSDMVPPPPFPPPMVSFFTRSIVQDNQTDRDNELSLLPTLDFPFFPAPFSPFFPGKSHPPLSRRTGNDTLPLQAQEKDVFLIFSNFFFSLSSFARPSIFFPQPEEPRGIAVQQAFSYLSIPFSPRRDHADHMTIPRKWLSFFFLNMFLLLPFGFPLFSLS